MSGERAVQVHAHLPDCCVGSYGGLLIAVWTGAATHDHVQLLESILKDLAAEHPRALGSLQMVRADSPVPDRVVRRAFASVLERYVPQTSAIALVVEGTGLWASAVRSFIVGVRLLVRQAVRMDVFDNAETALGWLAPLHEERTGVPINRAELAEAVRSINLLADQPWTGSVAGA